MLTVSSEDLSDLCQDDIAPSLIPDRRVTDPSLLEPHLALWSLTAEAPPAQTQTAVVQFVRRGEERLVLKLITHADEAGQRAALLHFGGRGAVRLVDWDGPALLMERAQPGEPLVRLVREGRDDQATA